MMIRKGVHPFIPNPNVKDWKGEDTIGACCPLERRNDIHRLEPTPEDDVTARILGEHDHEAM